jgi:hypothetical protein
MKPLCHRAKELETLLATEKATGRKKARDHVELLDERTPGGIFGGPGFDKEIALSELDSAERSERIKAMEAELNIIKARVEARMAIWVAVLIGFLNLTVTTLLAIFLYK